MSNPYAPPVTSGFRTSPSGDPSAVRRWDLSIIGSAWTLMQARMGENIGVSLLTLGVGLVFTLMSAAVQQLALRGGLDGDLAGLAGVVAQLVSLSGSVVQGYLGIGVLRFYLGQVRGEDVSFLEVFRGYRWVPSIVFGNVLVGFAVLASVVLLFIPAIVLGLGWMFWQSIVVDEDLGAIEALSASWRLTKGSKLDLLVLALVLGAINFGGVMLCGLGLLVTLPLSGLVTVMVYDNLRIVGPKSA